MPKNPADLPAAILPILATASESDASDVYLREDEVPRLRVNGQIWSAGETPLPSDQVSAFWQFCDADPARDRDFDAGFEAPNGDRFRVNLHRERDRIGAVLRRIKANIPNLQNVGAPYKLLTEWFSRPSGLILVAGPTGSGKSTTLAASLDWVNHNHSKHIVTIEDPIEYVFHNEMSYITQRAVGIDTESFVRGLRGALRQDPDIILVGEIRDGETAGTALQAAETGHVVVSTVHSSTVPETVERLTNLLPTDSRISTLQLLANQLIGVLCQRLVPTIEGGRALIVEHMENAGATRQWIEETALPEISEFIARGDSPANKNFLSSIIEACESGRISPQTAEAACANPTEFRRAYRGIS
jgi:twitching motility protein PilT